MSYVAYNINTTRLLQANKYFASEGAAKAAITRAAKKGSIDAADYAVAETNNFFDNIELMVERTNMMSGKKYMERANTPSSCSPASETYWCM